MMFLRPALILRLQQTLASNNLCLLNRHAMGSSACFSSGSGSMEINISDEESKRRLHNRLLYRSRQRGFLELDLVLGKWVTENICSMDEEKIRSLVDVLDLENPDLWKWLSGQELPPDAVNSNPVFASIQSRVLRNLNAFASPATRADPGQPWRTGWDDKGRPDGGPKHGNQ